MSFMGGFVIILAGYPVAEILSYRGLDIQLSGQTHDGQLFPVNWLAGLEYELSWGHIRKGRTEVFVTSGVQTWGPPVRTPAIRRSWSSGSASDRGPEGPVPAGEGRGGSRSAKAPRLLNLPGRIRIMTEPDSRGRSSAG